MPTSKLEFDVSSKFPFYVRLLMETVVEKIQVAIHSYFLLVWSTLRCRQNINPIVLVTSLHLM